MFSERKVDGGGCVLRNKEIRESLSVHGISIKARSFPFKSMDLKDPALLALDNCFGSRLRFILHELGT